MASAPLKFSDRYALISEDELRRLRKREHPPVVVNPSAAVTQRLGEELAANVEDPFISDYDRNLKHADLARRFFDDVRRLPPPQTSNHPSKLRDPDSGSWRDRTPQYSPGRLENLRKIRKRSSPTRESLQIRPDEDNVEEKNLIPRTRPPTRPPPSNKPNTRRKKRLEQRGYGLIGEWRSVRRRLG